MTLQEIALDPSLDPAQWQNFLTHVVVECYHAFEGEENPTIENLTQAARGLFEDASITHVFNEDVYESIAKRVIGHLTQKKEGILQSDFASETAELTIIGSLVELRSIGDDVDEDAVTRIFVVNPMNFDTLGVEAKGVLEEHFNKAGERKAPVNETVVRIFSGPPLPPKEVGADETPLPPPSPAKPEEEYTDAGELPPEDPPFLAEDPEVTAARIEAEHAAEQNPLQESWFLPPEVVPAKERRQDESEWYTPTPNQPSSRFGIVFLAVLVVLGAILAAVALRQTQEIVLPSAAATPVIKPVTEPLPTSVLPPEPPPAPLTTPQRRAHPHRRHKLDKSF